MLKILEFYGKYRGAKGSLLGLPGWARFLLLIAAIPGLALMALSILAFGVSLLALLLLTVPVYRLVSAVSGGRRETETDSTSSWAPEPTVFDPAPSPGRRQVDVKIIE